MEIYKTMGTGNPLPVVIDDYGGGLLRLRHFKAAYQGRLIFFMFERVGAVEKLIVLTVYKKESQTVPTNVMQRARQRMVDYKERNDKK